MNNILIESDFESLSFVDLKLPDNTLSHKHFIDCIFTNCDFTSCKFEGCTFNNCQFTECNLSLIKIPGCFVNHTSFLRCKMVGIDWTAAVWKTAAKKKQLFTNTFTESLLDYSLFVGLNLCGVKIFRCTAKEVYFERANLQEGDFRDTDFKGAIFSNCNLTQSDFSQSKNYSINPIYNNISKAKFSFPEVMSLLYTLDVEILG